MKGNENYFEVAGGFKLLITKLQEVYDKSRGNRFWFDLARVQVIMNQLYVHLSL